MHVHVKKTPRGISLGVTGAFIAEPLEIRFPEEVWETFPWKEAMLHELAYFMTLVTPLILRHHRVGYETPKPRFYDFYNTCFESAIPNMVDPIPHEDSDDVLMRFRSISRTFTGPPQAAQMEQLDSWDPGSVVLPFSFGKDSLLSLATLRELGYEVILVNIDERVLPRGVAIREGLKKRLRQDHGLSCHLVENEIQLLSDWQVLEMPETRLHQVHVYFVYLFAMLPFCTHFRAPLIIFNNERHHSLSYVNREGYILEHKLMQSRQMTEELARKAGEFSGGQVAAANLIGAMGDFAIHRILHEEFPDLAQYRVSCHMEMSDHERWCHDCTNCAHAFLFFLASGQDPFDAGFEESMLTEEKKKHLSLFKEPVHPEDEYTRFLADEEALAFYMASKKGASGPLVDLFKRDFLKETEKGLGRLKKRVFTLHEKPGKEPVVQEAHSLYETFLKSYRIS